MTGNRFGKRRRDFFIARDVLLPIAVVVAFLLLLNFGLESLGRRTESERLESARSAVVRAAVQCYALEGRYPLSVRYLEESYGLSVDRERYIIHYQAFASNLMPDIDVFPIDLRGVSAEGDEPFPDDFGDFDDIWDFEFDGGEET